MWGGRKRVFIDGGVKMKGFVALNGPSSQRGEEPIPWRCRSRKQQSGRMVEIHNTSDSARNPSSFLHFCLCHGF